MQRTKVSAGRTALVLAGGAARGAYEVGVVDYVAREVRRALGRPVGFDILCGTSVGALNACALAAFADEPTVRTTRLAEVWGSLSMTELVRFDTAPMAALLARVVLGPRSDESHALRSTGILDPRGLEALLGRAIPFGRIPEQLARGHLSALTVSTTHVATGRTVVFVQRREGGLPAWSHDPTIVPRATTIGLPHALASAAIPPLFRAVRIDGQYHADGGLRQNVPFSPARRLGADRMLVINPRYLAPAAASLEEVRASDASAKGESPPGAVMLLGKALNALLLDRLDTDLARLEGINRILAAGASRYGDTFLRELNAALGNSPERGIRPLGTMLVRASEDIGQVAVEHAKSASFRKRVKGAVARLAARLAERGDGDLLSYVLFDGLFARTLIHMGRRDAAARHEELVAFFGGVT